MHRTPKRPASVWISQIVLVLYAALMLFGILMVVLLMPPGAGVTVLPALLIAVVIFGGFAALLLAGFWGLLKRRRWGRWLTVGLFSFMFLTSSVNQLATIALSPSSAYTGGYIFGSLLILIPFAYLIFRLAFGDPAVDFFTFEDPEPEFATAPPPPPTFEP